MPTMSHCNDSALYYTADTLSMSVPCSCGKSDDDVASFYQPRVADLGHDRPHLSTFPYNAATYSASPPEADSGLSLSSGSGGYNSYSTSSTIASMYARSVYAESDDNGEADYASEELSSMSGVDLTEYMHDRFVGAFDPLPMDKCTTLQAQASGKLNATQRRLLEIQAKAQDRLKKAHARFAHGMQDAREVRADLEWTEKKLASLKTKASKKHAKEYAKARARYPSPEY